MTTLPERISACTACSLHRTRTNVVVGRGAAQPRLLLVGEAPGAEEDKQGLPFVGASGRLLTKLLAKAEIPEDQVYILNLLKCRPPGNRDPEPVEVAACKPFLVEQFQFHRPKGVVTLGRFAATYLSQVFGPLGALMKDTTLTCDLGGEAVPLTPLYHPAYLLRCIGQNDAKPLFQDTVKRLQHAWERSA